MAGGLSPLSWLRPSCDMPFWIRAITLSVRVSGSAGVRSRGLFLAGLGLRWRPSRSAFRSTAITRSAPIARHSDTGTGLTRPPSTSQLPSCSAGVNSPGSAIEARTASVTRPSRSQISRPRCRSVATAPNGRASSRMSRSTKWLRKNSISRSPLISPLPSEKSRKPTTVCRRRLRTQVSSRSSSPPT